MRILPFLLSATLALLPSAAAQTADDDGCTHAAPCPWVVDVDAGGFQSYVQDEVTYTVGDWYEITVFSDDPDRSHTITLSGHDVSITVEADGMAEDTGAFQLGQAGDFTLKDMPSGDTILVHVVEEDAVAEEDDDAGAASSGKGEGAPFTSAAFLAMALAVLVVALRRR